MKKHTVSERLRPLAVATVHSEAGLRIASGIGAGGADVLELRADALADRLAQVRKFLAKRTLPILLTVRHPAEGGVGNLSIARRREIFAEFLPHAALVDIELRSVGAMRGVIAAARERGIRVVISDHHFRRTPTLSQMCERRERAFAAGADVFKIACLTDGAGAVARLLDFVSAKKSRPLAVMGMGKLGQASRLVLACAGSVLNYGYLDKPNAPGQWEARELKALLRRLVR